jgi:hypothetical protein
MSRLEKTRVSTEQGSHMPEPGGELADHGDLAALIAVGFEVEKVETLLIEFITKLPMKIPLPP